ncbi:hypothetical protein Q4Q34_07895 [Flavivirga abyssicola]|uniref:hypothetical protein n=1 Tax=Flavivirga abyssicola TaxID=3063533 RepID=UPI0026DF634E|nr:hypothetical protein [Flavivirga sp. MEBiC07777]WVK14948.1 hypothetical protein Q4Q34_07895 [Flavivirga sp. MEBiC07777]
MKKVNKIKLVVFLVVNFVFITESVAQGASSINSQRRYDEVSWLITHNANNNRTDGPGGFFGCLGGGNQSRGIQKQLEDGIRNFMVDIYRVNGELRLKHGSPNMCMMDAKDFNNIIGNWLENHPLDIITLHIESGPNLGISGLNDIFFGRRNGYKNMSRFIYNHKTFESVNRPKGAGSDVYPTIQEMLDADKQLVIFTGTNYNSDLYRYEFLHTAQNPYRAGQVSELADRDKFRVERGIDHKTILTINHFAGDAPTYNGDVNKSKEANAGVWVKATNAWYYFGHRPSIAVDYYSLSNGSLALTQINNLNKINEVRGRFIDVANPSNHVRGVKAYVAEFRNGSWEKVKDVAYKGVRAKWHLFYSLPARVNDNRAIFFEHPDFTFSPEFINVGNYKGNNSETFVVNINATRKNTSKIDDGKTVEGNDNILITNLETLEDKIIFNNKTNIDSVIEAKLYDLSGRLIDTMAPKIIEGTSKIEWNTTKNLKGIYVIKELIEGEFFVKKMLFY